METRRRWNDSFEELSENMLEFYPHENDLLTVKAK